MYKYLIAAVCAALASAQVYTTPTSQCTNSCNPISAPGLNQVVTAGTPFQIRWNPTTQGTVTIVLVKGPSTNVVPVYAIANKIPNSGAHSWTPATDLQSTGDSGYGLQLISDADGTYQYSTQFGISNPSYSSGGVSSSASAPPGSSIAPTLSTFPSSVTKSTASTTASLSSSYATVTESKSGFLNSTVSVTSSGASASTTSGATVGTTSRSSSASASTSPSLASAGAVLTVGLSGLCATLFAAFMGF